MPMTFTDNMVTERLKMGALDTSGTSQEQRERLANFVEEKYQDFVEGYEIRSGKPWTQMTIEEAQVLVDKHPNMLRNPGILSRLGLI